MRVMQGLVVVVIGFQFLACSASTLTAGGQTVRVQKGDPPSDCEEVGFVEGASSNLVSNYKENARNKMRNEAAARGANYLRLESEVIDGNGVRYESTAFKCP